MNDPEVVVLLAKHGLQDGRKTRSGQQQLISNRLQFLEISRGGDVNPAGSAPYLDYRPMRETEQPLMPQHLDEVNTGRNAPHRFRLALVTVEGDRAPAPVYVSGMGWGLPGFGDTQITKNLQQLLAVGRAPH